MVLVSTWIPSKCVKMFRRLEERNISSDFVFNLRYPKKKRKHFTPLVESCLNTSDFIFCVYDVP